jgi:YebC/PmpR family DNA-binding regulatory protein
MAGHSKWANIRFRKMGQDAKRGKLFTKFIREITVSARAGGGDVSTNPRLRAVIDKSLAANMTRDTIDRAIKRGTGDQEGQQLEEIRYEGYGPGGVAVIVDCLSDNRNRTVSEVRHAFTKHGGNLGTDGSVSYLFRHKGLITFPETVDEAVLFEAAIDLGAEDVTIEEDGSRVVETSFESFYAIQLALEAQKLKPERAETTMVPDIMMSMEAEQAQKFMKMVDVLEDLDDVQVVHTNADIPDELLEA